MKGDKECEDHNCEGLRYCHWHPDNCIGKPWKECEKMKEETFANKATEKRIKLIENNIKNLYMMMSAKGDFDIHSLKERDPKLYAEIMGEKK